MKVHGHSIKYSAEEYYLWTEKFKFDIITASSNLYKFGLYQLYTDKF